MCEIPPPYSREDELEKIEAQRRSTTRNSISINWARPYHLTLWEVSQVCALWLSSVILLLILFWLYEAFKTADILCDTIPDQDKPALFRRTAAPCPTCPAYEKVELDPAELEDLINSQDFL